MAPVKKPKRHQSETPDETQKEKAALAFVNRAGAEPEEHHQNKKPIMVRVHPDMLKRIDWAAKSLGISRSALMISSTAKAIKRMEKSE